MHRAETFMWILSTKCCLSPSSLLPFLPAQVSPWLPVEQIAHWCSFGLHFLPLFQSYFLWDFPAKHFSREEWEWGKEEQARFQYTALRATEMFESGVGWSVLWWPHRVHQNNCSLKSMGRGVKFSVEIFPVGVPGSNSLPPSHPPSQTSCDLWRTHIPSPKRALF